MPTDLNPLPPLDSDKTIIPIRWHIAPAVPVRAYRKQYRIYTIFVPDHSFEKCAAILDTPELRVAIIGVLRTLKYLARPRPLSHLRQRDAENWRGYEQACVRYGIYVASEYVRRGGSNKALDYLKTLVQRGEWLKPSGVYVSQTHNHSRVNLIHWGLRRMAVKAVGASFSGGLGNFLQTTGYSNLRDCDNDALRDIIRCAQALDNHITHPRLYNFYSQYIWEFPHPIEAGF